MMDGAPPYWRLREGEISRKLEVYFPGAYTAHRSLNVNGYALLQATRRGELRTLLCGASLSVPAILPHES